MVSLKLLKKINNYQTCLAFLVIFTSSLLLFFQSLNYYFFQDDWFVLNWVRTGTLKSFFEFRTDIIYWRPLSMPLFFWLGKSLFKFNPYYFHLLAFIFHFVNVLLIGQLSYLMFKNDKARIITMLLYATASFHFMSLSWLSLTWNTIGFMFFMISLIFYLNFKKIKSNINTIGTLVFLILALASNEFAILFVLAILILDFILEERLSFNYVKDNFILLSSITIISVYLFIRTFIYPIPAQGEYSTSIDHRIIKNLLWYILWLFNLPEELKYQVVLSNFHITNIFLRASQNYLPYLLALFIINLITLFRILISNLGRTIFKLAIVSTLFFSVGLAPVLLLPNHSFPYYLTIPSIFIFIFIGNAFSIFLKKNKDKKAAKIILLFIVSWILLSWTSLSLTRKIHWVTAEQNLSRQKIEFTKNQYPVYPMNSVIEIHNSSKQIVQSLLDQNAMQVIYNNDNIKTIYK